MKTATSKVTYSLDTATVLAIEELATTWGVPKSEVVRRAVHAASERRDELGHRPLSAAEALAELQREPRLSPSAAAAWTERVRAERRGTYG
jgi:Arc/MetJ-type ribon-helix-helix transcriptional regulator